MADRMSHIDNTYPFAFSVKFCREQVDGKKYIGDETTVKDLKRGLYEVWQNVIKGSLKPEQAVALFQELVVSVITVMCSIGLHNIGKGCSMQFILYRNKF